MVASRKKIITSSLSQQWPSKPPAYKSWMDAKKFNSSREYQFILVNIFFGSSIGRMGGCYPLGYRFEPYPKSQFYNKNYMYMWIFFFRKKFKRYTLSGSNPRRAVEKLLGIVKLWIATYNFYLIRGIA